VNLFTGNIDSIFRHKTTLVTIIFDKIYNSVLAIDIMWELCFLDVRGNEEEAVCCKNLYR